MWALFTAALTRASSTTRVSVVNVSSNFMVTAILGFVIFGEGLPGLWWVGAGLLAVGNVIIGRRVEGGEEKGGLVGSEAEVLLDLQSRGGGRDEPVTENERVELRSAAAFRDEDEQERLLRRGEDVDDPL